MAPTRGHAPIKSRELVTVIESGPISESNEADIEAAQAGEDGAPMILNFHAVGVRPIGTCDTAIPNSPPF